MYVFQLQLCWDQLDDWPGSLYVMPDMKQPYVYYTSGLSDKNWGETLALGITIQKEKKTLAVRILPHREKFPAIL